MKWVYRYTWSVPSAIQFLCQIQPSAERVLKSLKDSHDYSGVEATNTH